VISLNRYKSRAISPSTFGLWTLIATSLPSNKVPLYTDDDDDDDIDYDDNDDDIDNDDNEIFTSINHNERSQNPFSIPLHTNKPKMHKYNKISMIIK
jgi:hypothetical protein